jgi:hypothetical protein
MPKPPPSEPAKLCCLAYHSPYLRSTSGGVGRGGPSKKCRRGPFGGECSTEHNLYAGDPGSSQRRRVQNCRQTNTAAAADDSVEGVGSSTGSTPDRIWDGAYCSLKKDEPKLLAYYEKFLTRELLDRLDDSDANIID